MGFSESGHGCKIHSDHHGKQGVCPSCLRERLSSLSWIGSYKYTFMSCSPDSVLSSISVSPSQRDAHKQSDYTDRMGIVGSPSFSSSTMKVGVKKSRSIGFVPRNFEDDDEEKDVNDGKKEKGFWSKLLRFKGKNKVVLRYSKSMRLMGRVHKVS